MVAQGHVGEHKCDVPLLSEQSTQHKARAHIVIHCVEWYQMCDTYGISASAKSQDLQACLLLCDPSRGHGPAATHGDVK